LAKVLNVAVFASGRGSNFRAILDNIDRGEIKARISIIISNRSDAGIFNIAQDRNIPYRHINPSDYTTEKDYCSEVLSLLDECSVGLIVLAGYLKKIPSEIITQYRNRIMNIHPALLPAFGGQGMYGMKVHQAVVEYGAKVTGVTVHFVDEEYDHGPIILQEPIGVDDDDTPELLAEKVLSVEHRVYSRAIKLFAEDRLSIDGRRVYVKNNKGK